MHRAAAIIAALAPTLALACHPHLERRGPVNAARGLDRSSEAAEALITDPQTECSYYSYPPANDIINTYPTIWATADLSNPGISAADRALFASINSSIPNIPVRGNRYGDFSGIQYDKQADPDCWWSSTHCVTPKLPGLLNDTVACNEANTWGLTLDDGPNCSHNAYYDYLQSQNQKATLFYIGSNVLDWPLEAQRGLADGHELCAHTFSHPYMTGLTNEQVFAELYFSKKAIKEVTGVTVRCWRPPYGDVDDRVRYIASKLDMRTVVWNEDTDDWNWSNVGMAAVRANYQGILDDQTAGKFDRSGTIVLTHELDNGTMALSEEFLPHIRQQFVGGVMPVAVCSNNTRPYVETADYVYPDYAQWAAGTTTVSLASPTAGAVASLLFSPSPAPTSASSSATGASASATASSSATSASTTSSDVSRTAIATASRTSASAAASSVKSVKDHTSAGVAQFSLQAPALLFAAIGLGICL
ncbi:hypothetical protein C6P46_004073 [Rhodotorula mucilaginosa]|uniref:chitin deacetylase n=1 Tax=Rhodotorula mucilaginosa TaxID=5537 RepID=A0A9P7B6V2_RHOMI|nr:hypothetical protein C6P46_004073 [Rhodotorula mucilaginosa]